MSHAEQNLIKNIHFILVINCICHKIIELKNFPKKKNHNRNIITHLKQQFIDSTVPKKSMKSTMYKQILKCYERQ